MKAQQISNVKSRLNPSHRAAATYTDRPIKTSQRIDCDKTHEEAAKLQPRSPDQEMSIVERGISGDADALATLFACNRPKLLRAAFLLLRNHQDAEDAVQDGLLSAYRNLKSFEGRSQFSTWLTRIVLNAALMNRRRRQSRQRLCLQNSDFCEDRLISRALEQRPDPEEEFISTETRNLVHRRANYLPPLLRSAFYLRDVGQLSVSEASKVARVNVSALKSRTTRARRRLANLLAAEGILPRPADFRSTQPPWGRARDRKGANAHD
jgi:RNA polymerase sigma-70 factor, ECF subfamily